MKDDHHEKWPIDGQYHKGLGLSDIYTNKSIKRFLETEEKRLLIAPKGMGKTLLLRAKKYSMEQNSSGIIPIPRESESDIPDFQGTRAVSTLRNWQRFKDQNLWKELWSVAISLSALSHLALSEQEHLNLVKEFQAKITLGSNRDSSLQEIVEAISTREQCRPSIILNRIINMGVQDLEALLNKLAELNHITEKYVKSGVSIFIDNFDATLSTYFPDDKDLWCNPQIGLALASHRLYCNNKHLKVFASIRHEAWLEYTGEDRQVMLGSALVIDYSKRELSLMFDHAVRRYSGFNSLRDFLKISQMPNERTGENEPLFDYIYRHSVPTPRSLMMFGAKLDDADLERYNQDERVKEVRRIVNEESSNQYLNDYFFSQRTMFLKGLDSREKMNVLLSLLPGNVLRGKTICDISKELYLNHGVGSKDVNPFSELLNVGLLGTLKLDSVKNQKVQSFRRPSEFEMSGGPSIDPARLYLVHPSLHLVIGDLRGDYKLDDKCVVGDELPWVYKDSELDEPVIFISHSSLDKERLELVWELLRRKLAVRRPCDLWIDTEKIDIGESILKEIDKGIERSRLLLFFVSASSIASGWVEEEVARMNWIELNKGKVSIMCCIIDGTSVKDLPGGLAKKRAITLNFDDSRNLEALIEELADSIARKINDQ